ncbi:MAG: CHASE2 domain-containing protein, partial [Cyanobacteria bacterium P01_A01_bin.84]
MTSFHLKIRRVEKVCTFELSWGMGQQLTTVLDYPEHLTNLYTDWQWKYLKFYQSLVRGRVGSSGSIPIHDTDWRTKLVQAEAKLLSEFYYWLNSAELLEVRKAIVSQNLTQKNYSSSIIDVFLTCHPPDLARFPWETWEIGAEFSSDKTIRIARTPTNIRSGVISSPRREKIRILAIMGDSTGLNLSSDKETLQSLSKIAEVQFIGWETGENIEQLKSKICQALVSKRGWDVLFFAGHSNETSLTGGELVIAPNQSILISEIATQLTIAKNRGLQFAIFNSCNGMGIANALIDLGLAQVAVMREPIHNIVAQEFLVRFVENLWEYKDAHESLIEACQYLKIEKSLTYPSAYLIPSLFRHPHTPVFKLQPSGWRSQLKRFLPTKFEAIALSTIMLLGWLNSTQEWLIEKRVLMQAVYRQQTNQVNRNTSPNILIVQIDEESIQKAKIAQPNPISRNYLARIINQLYALDAKVIGVDYLLERNPKYNDSDKSLFRSVSTSVNQKNTWFIFASRYKDGKYSQVRPQIAQPTWSLQGDIWIPLWNVKPLPWYETTPKPFSYQLATAYKLEQKRKSLSSHNEVMEKGLIIPIPTLENQEKLTTQVQAYINNSSDVNNTPFISKRSELQPITAFSYQFNKRWLQPILDFSIPPTQIYDIVPAWQILEDKQAFLQSRSLKSLEQTIVIIAPGGYDEAGISINGEDNFPLTPALSYLRNLQKPADIRES